MPIAEVDLNELRQIARQMDRVGVPWCVCGGWAIDLCLDELSRPHKDIDVAVRRMDQSRVQSYLIEEGWTLEVAHGGRFTPWKLGESLELPHHAIWCRKGAWFFEILLNEWDAEFLRYRRDQSIFLPADLAITQSRSGLPALTTELVLLYKCTASESPENQSDFQAACVEMRSASKQWLRESIAKSSPKHPWLDHLA